MPLRALSFALCRALFALRIPARSRTLGGSCASRGAGLPASPGASGTPSEGSGGRAEEFITPSEESITPSEEFITPSEEFITPSEEFITPSEEFITGDEEFMRRLPKPEMGVCAAENRVGRASGGSKRHMAEGPSKGLGM